MSLHIPPALLHRRFRLLWFGMMISIAGTQMQLWSIFWHIRTITPEPIALGAVGLARIVPVIIFSLIGGAVADLADRRKVMFITQSVMALGAHMTRARSACVRHSHKDTVRGTLSRPEGQTFPP